MMNFLIPLLWIFPYFMSAILAPFIFKSIQPPEMAGHIAGFFFALTGVWSIVVSIIRGHYSLAQLYLMLSFFFQVIFWLWRFMIPGNLHSSYLLGIVGTRWHGILTTMYLIGALILIFGEIRLYRMRKLTTVVYPDVPLPKV